MRRVTIADVARRSGFSIAAVSSAFNHPERLSASTVSHILQIAQELGYAPNPLAPGLRRSQMLGVLVPQPLSTIFANPFFSAFLQGVGTICDDQRFGLLTIAPLEDSVEKALARAPVDGFIIVGLNEYHHELQPLRKRHMPFVIVDGDVETVSAVNVDDEGGAYAAASYLLERGHRELLILTFETPYGHLDEPSYGVGGRRLQGFMRACAAYDVAWQAEWLVPCVSTIEGGREGFRAAWAAGQRPSAVLTVSDVMALGVVQVAPQLGLRVPDDVLVIGFDDIALAALVQPALSTVRQPIMEKGVLAAEIVIEQLEQSSASVRREVLPTSLILRNTTR